MRRAVPMTHSDDQRARQRRYVITLGGESHMGSLLFDLRHAVRALISSPVFTAVTVITLALGIGANSAIFSLVNAVLLRPLGYQDPERLMMIHEIIPESRVPRFGVSPADYLDLDQYQGSFTDIGVYRTRTDGAVGQRHARKHQRGADLRRGVPAARRRRRRGPHLPARRGSIRAIGRGDQRVAAPPPLRRVVADRRAASCSIAGRTRSSA